MIDTAKEASRSDLMEPALRIEQLLSELRATAGPQVWPRVDELVSALVTLYGEGLARLLAALDEVGRARLRGDELVASLLELHGLVEDPGPLVQIDLQRSRRAP
jgi:hypothetical protein